MYVWAAFVAKTPPTHKDFTTFITITHCSLSPATWPLLLTLAKQTRTDTSFLPTTISKALWEFIVQTTDYGQPVSFFSKYPKYFGWLGRWADQIVWSLGCFWMCSQQTFFCHFESLVHDFFINQPFYLKKLIFYAISIYFVFGVWF